MYPPNSVIVNMDSYLVSFVVGMLHGDNSSVIVPHDHYIGNMLYDLLEKVPENCQFKPPVIERKKQLTLYVYTLGRAVDGRKRTDTHYYFPQSRQQAFEKNIRMLFDELFFNTISITKEYTDDQIRKLIESFCLTYNIDYPQHSDALIKKYYRERKKREKNAEIFQT